MVFPGPHLHHICITNSYIFHKDNVPKRSCEMFQEEMLHYACHITPQNNAGLLEVVSAQWIQTRLPLRLSTKFKYDNQVQSFVYQSMITILSRFQYVQCPYRKMLPSQKETIIKKDRNSYYYVHNYKLDTSWTLFLEHEVAISNRLSSMS